MINLNNILFNNKIIKHLSTSSVNYNKDYFLDNIFDNNNKNISNKTKFLDLFPAEDKNIFNYSNIYVVKAIELKIFL